MNAHLLTFTVIFLRVLTVQGYLPEFDDPIDGQLVVSLKNPPFLTLKWHPDISYYVPTEDQLSQIEQAVKQQNQVAMRDDGQVFRAGPNVANFMFEGESSLLSRQDFEEGKKKIRLYTKSIGTMLIGMLKGYQSKGPIELTSLYFEDINYDIDLKTIIVDESNMNEWLEVAGTTLKMRVSIPIDQIINALQECSRTTGSNQVSGSEFQFDTELGGSMTYYKVNCKRQGTSIIIFLAVYYNTFTLTPEDFYTAESACGCRYAFQMTRRMRRLTPIQKSELIGYFIDVIAQSIQNEYKHMIDDISIDHQEKACRPQTNGVPYKIVSRSSGKMLDIERISKGAKVIQNDYHGTGHQQWYFREILKDTYTIISVQSGMALRVPWWSKENGAQLQLHMPYNAPNQSFRLEPVENGFCRIRVIYSDKVVSVDGASHHNSAPIVQWDNYNGHHQHWRIERH